MSSSQKRAAPPFRVDHVGSFLRPAAIVEAFQKWEAGDGSEDVIRKLPNAYVADIVQFQEQLGFQAITDGEFRRRSWQRGFIDAVGGFAVKPGIVPFRNASGPVKPIPSMFVEEKLNRTRGIATDDFLALRKLTSRVPKITLPAPSIFHFGLFSRFANPRVYPDIGEVFEDLVAIYRQELAELGALGCHYVQLDEVGLVAMCDETNRDIAKKNGEDPDAIVDLYFDLNRRVLAARPPGMTVAMHVCRGNQAGLWLASGGYDSIADRLFHQDGVEAFLLEYDSPRAGDFAPLRHVPARKIAMIGIVSTKNPEVESADSLKRRIDEAQAHAPLDRLGLCPQCGFASSISSWNVTENPMTEDLQRRKLERMVDVARNVWGGTE